MDRCYSDITCENAPPNDIFSGRMSEPENEQVDGRTSGSVKAMEVSLKQDFEISRVEGEYDDINSGNGARVSTLLKGLFLVSAVLFVV